VRSLVLLIRFRKEDIEEMDYADNYFDLLFAEEKMKNPYLIESINNSKYAIYSS